jgi:enoyl-CoA hydratase/carnithine racemase
LRRDLILAGAISLSNGLLEVHHGIIHAMFDINNDPENECLIITGTGNSFLAEFDHDSWRNHGFSGQFGETHAYDVFYRDQTRTLDPPTKGQRMTLGSSRC